MDHDLKFRATGKFGPRGERYEVLLGGEVIASGVSPEFAACRAMQERGALGFIRLWREGGSTWDLRLSIKTGALLSVMENAKAGPRFVKWAPFEKPIEWTGENKPRIAPWRGTGRPRRREDALRCPDSPACFRRCTALSAARREAT